MFRLALATPAVTDVFITSALVWQINRPELLWNPQTKRYLSFYDIHISGHSLIPPPLHRLVARISSLAIKTGLIPCVYTLTSLVTYVSHVIPNICEFFTFMLGRVYTLSMLFTLIYRDKLFSDGGLMKMDSTFRLPTSITCASEWDHYTFLLLAHFFQSNGSTKIRPVNPPGLR